MRSSCAFLVLAVILALPAGAATIRVPANQPTIQAGINAATFAGDTVLVAPGTYSGVGNRDLDFLGRNIIVRSSDGPSITIIDCGSAGRGCHLSSGETRAAVIEGFSIRSGRAEWPAPEFGGGISCEDASPTISDCWITQCSAERGGGVYLLRSGAAIIECNIAGCHAGGSGGGIWIDDPEPRVDIVGSTIYGNNAFSFDGGGILANGSGKISISQSEISFNTAGAEFGKGGGVSCSGGGLRLAMTDCILERNTQTSLGDNSFSEASGGGVYALADSAVLVRCAFDGNAARGINDDASNQARGGGATLIVDHVVLDDCSFIDNESESRSMVTQGGFGKAQGGGLFCESGTSSITDCRFEGNVATSIGGRFGNEAAGGAIYGSNLTIYGCVFTRNGVVASPPSPYEGYGGGTAIEAGSHIGQCTFAENWATTRGSNIAFRGAGTAQVEKTIVAFGGISEAVSCGGVVLSISCTDVFGNATSDWTGCLAGLGGANGNFSSDPLFCDIEGRDLGLAADSPCAPGHSGPCGLVGALPVSCGPIGVADAGVAPVGLKLRVIPNPVHSAARFELGSIAPTARLNIFDSQGRIVQQLMPQEGNWSWTPGSSIPAGVYFASPDEMPPGASPVKFLYLR